MSMPSYPQQPNADQGQYGAQYGAPEPTRNNGFAVTALVLGLLACLFFWTVVGGLLLGLLALVFGILGALRARGGQAPRKGMAIAGAVLGALGLIGSVVVLIIGISLFNSESFQDLQDCVDRAETQAQEDRCAEDFGENLFK
ncbi:DUF4190 domain-containing protein [Streptomyces sp. NPDC012389]|uniref:DUF4190 domain-containing protein n=1 Tax=unclassified Streptomyces TaxID=2593676 RepID=UPI00081D6B2E|nr:MULTISPECIES: DUF4190 domain-containing protein [unclassified Streptomyces]MYR93792.1 DUF4190 domain-containing protein [Streptomyces sp. SID4937]MYX18244.1 DUF4190 domain-containing protein [Streptomyces sp. SID8374]SCD59306.1 hypothetical protein GA0115243_1033102 [Streptomyces sp. ScaeMP-e83]